MSTLLSELPVRGAGPLEPIDEAVFRANFNRAPFKIGHRLQDNPLFTLPRLIELAQRLPQSRVEYNAGNLPVSVDPKSTPLNGLSIEDTIARIEQCQSWMVLKNVELDPQYSDLLDECLAAIRPYSEQVAPGMRQREAFIFISSPGSVTPFHIDPENNFLLQVRGTKQVQLFDASDRLVLSDSDVEAFYCGAHRNLVYNEEYSSRGQWYDLGPGEGLHFPVIAPHWVKNGPAVSISFSITFRTNSSDALATLYRLNRKLRGYRLPAAPVGLHPRCDALKLRTIQTLQTIKRRVTGRDSASASGGY
jgi:hypothetical protein